MVKYYNLILAALQILRPVIVAELVNFVTTLEVQPDNNDVDCGHDV